MQKVTMYNVDTLQWKQVIIKRVKDLILNEQTTLKDLSLIFKIFIG